MRTPATAAPAAISPNAVYDPLGWLHFLNTLFYLGSSAKGRIQYHLEVLGRNGYD